MVLLRIPGNLENNSFRQKLQNLHQGDVDVVGLQVIA